MCWHESGVVRSSSERSCLMLVRKNSLRVNERDKVVVWRFRYSCLGLGDERMVLFL